MATRRIKGFHNETIAVNCMDKPMLERIFTRCNEEGVYLSCQPLYGFRKLDKRPGDIQWYTITYRILNLLSRLRFSSVLDVGAAEGFKAFLAKQQFDVKVACCDLSEEACKRAREIFGLPSVCVNNSFLPFRDGAFDVVLCSETLEHVPNLPAALGELVRVARKAVIITVPHESAEVIERNIRGKGKGSSHIHAFTLRSFDFLPYRVSAQKVLSPITKFLSIPIEAVSKPYHHKMQYPRMFVALYNKSLPILKKLFSYKAAVAVIKLDHLMSKLPNSYTTMSFLICKDDSAIKKQEGVSASRIVNSSVPFHYLKTS